MALNLLANRGSLTARVFENKKVGLKPTLFFDILMPVEEFEYNGEPQETAVVLNFIKFAVEHWRDLEGRTFSFPKNPTDGYIDGSLYLEAAHNPVDVTEIRFGAFEGSHVNAEFKLEIDFTYEGPEELGVVPLSWSVDLEFDEAALDDCILEAEARRAVGATKPWWKLW